MRKKFIVETDYDKMTEKNMRDILFGRCQYGNTDYKVTELPSLPEVRKIETGSIDIPKSVLLKINGIANFISDGDRIDLVKYPDAKQFCKKESILITWDFSLIPKGSLIEIVRVNTCKYWGDFHRFDDVRIWYGITGEMLVSEIKSIRIIELPKE